MSSSLISETAQRTWPHYVLITAWTFLWDNLCSEKRKCERKWLSFLCFYREDKLKQEVWWALYQQHAAQGLTLQITPLWSVLPLQRRAIFTQQLAQLFHRHSHTDSTTHSKIKGQRRRRTHKKSSKLFPVWGSASLYHHASRRRGVNGCCFQNTWKQTNSSAYNRHSTLGGGAFTMNWE